MKPSRCSFVAAILCAAGLSAGLCFCVVTSFSVPTDALRLLIVCVCVSVLFSLLFLLKRTGIWLILLGVAAFASGYVFRSAFKESLSVLLFSVSSPYAEAITGFQPIVLSQTAATADATLALAVPGGLCALLCVWTLMRGKRLVWLLLFVLPILTVCLIILQTPPAPWAIVLVVLILSLLLLTQLLRRKQQAEGNRLLLLLFLPLALLVGGLFVLFPAESYTRADWSDALQTSITTAAEQLRMFRRDGITGQLQLSSPLSPSTLGSYLWDSSVTGVNLSRIGPQKKLGRSVMRVRSAASGICHLRGNSLAAYEDNRWNALSDDAYAGVPDAEQAIMEGELRVAQDEESFLAISSAYTMQIETDMKSGVYYTPYFPTVLPEGAQPFFDAYIKNPSQRTNYAVLYRPTRTEPNGSAAYDAFVQEVYTQVPDATRTALSDILPSLIEQTDGMQTLDTVKTVCQYVSASARYDLNTATVPAGEDFVSWFLHGSETGYCVHFATAATLLLRCMEIPARYVTGYCVNLEAGEWTQITSDDAHAWVEVYLEGQGWQVFDPTPAASELITTAPVTAASEKETELPAQEQTGQPEQTPAEKQTEPQTPDAEYPVKTSEQETQEKTPFSPVRLIFAVLLPVAVAVLWRATLFLIRKAAMQSGSANRRCLVYYHHLENLSRLSKTPIPQELQELAEKARFSNHRLSPSELAPMQAHTEALTKQLLSDRRILRQVLYRVIYALG